MTAEHYVHLVTENADKTVCNLDSSTASREGLSRQRTGDQGVSRQ